MIRARARVAIAVATIVATGALACRPGPRVGAPCAAPRGFAPFDHRRPAPRDAAPDGVLDGLVALYQEHGRARGQPGAGCPFAPTCSAYARTALRRYGPLGAILIVDRLIVREHPAASAYYPAICVANTTRLVDGVP